MTPSAVSLNTPNLHLPCLNESKQNDLIIFLSRAVHRTASHKATCACCGILENMLIVQIYYIDWLVTTALPKRKEKDNIMCCTLYFIFVVHILQTFSSSSDLTVLWTGTLYRHYICFPPRHWHYASYQGVCISKRGTESIERASVIIPPLGI